MEKELIKNPAFKKLCKSLAGLKKEKDVAVFLRDVATLSELTGMSERLLVAEMIQKGIPYRTINKETGVSTTTITRVAYWLHHGMGGYQLVLKHIHPPKPVGKRSR